MARVVDFSIPASARPIRSSASAPRSLKRRRGFFSEIETVGAAVGRIVAPFDEAGGGQFVDQPPECDRREVERLRKFVLLGSLAALQAREHRPLGAGGAEFAGPLVGIGPEQPSDVMERETQLAGRGDRPFVSKR